MLSPGFVGNIAAVYCLDQQYHKFFVSTWNKVLSFCLCYL